MFTIFIDSWPYTFCSCGPNETGCGATGCGCTNLSPPDIRISIEASNCYPPLFDPKDFVDFHWDPGEDDQPRGRHLAAAPAQRLPWREYARVRH